MHKLQPIIFFRLNIQVLKSFFMQKHQIEISMDIIEGIQILFQGKNSQFYRKSSRLPTCYNRLFVHKPPVIDRNLTFRNPSMTITSKQHFNAFSTVQYLLEKKSFQHYSVAIANVQNAKNTFTLFHLYTVIIISDFSPYSCEKYGFFHIFYCKNRIVRISCDGNLSFLQW